MSRTRGDGAVPNDCIQLNADTVIPYHVLLQKIQNENPHALHVHSFCHPIPDWFNSSRNSGSFSGPKQIGVGGGRWSDLSLIKAFVTHGGWGRLPRALYSKPLPSRRGTLWRHNLDPDTEFLSNRLHEPQGASLSYMITCKTDACHPSLYDLRSI